MKKILGFVTVVLTLGFVLASCAGPMEFEGAARQVWSPTGADKADAIEIDGVPSGRTNASDNGFKISSNGQNKEFPFIVFVWEQKQKDQGYVRVEAGAFDYYESIMLTAKNSSVYTDYVIEKPDFDADYYVFFIPKVAGKNINMVWLNAEVKEVVVELPKINLGFIFYYEFDFGGDVGKRVLSTSNHWQLLEKPGDMIDWDAVDAAYADWVAKGGLAPDRTLWRTSGYASFTFEDYAAKGYGDFNLGQLENYYKAYYVDPGYILPEVDLPPVKVSYCRYRAYVQLWNDLREAASPNGNYNNAIANQLAADGGMDHYRALLASAGAGALPPYFAFAADKIELYDYWADRLEVGLLKHASAEELADWVIKFTDAKLDILFDV